MQEIIEERIRMLVKVSTLYYIDGLNQLEIAQRLGISRPQISRMLSAARSEGIVHISIKDPFSQEHQIERELIETFGIKNAVVVHVPGADKQLLDQHLGRSGAELVESIFRNQDIVGVMAGRSITNVCTELNYFSRKNMQFVPLIGGWGAEGSECHANANARMFGEKLKSKYWILNAPAIVGSKQARDIIMEEQDINEVIKLGKRATTILIGIGQVSEDATIVRSGYFKREVIYKMQSRGAVANICTSFLDESGDIIPYNEENHMIGLSALEMREAKNVIAFASGHEKIEAIRAALHGKWIDVLVTDISTANTLLKRG
ncbi:MAG: MarR family transcriptional regulator [Neobacillus sp.]|nr:MarR family transcriptional regulator [Neobacillus sp.]